MHRFEGVAVPAEGELVAVQVHGTKVAVTVVEGQVRAVDDECTHQQCSLSDGEVEDGALVCPCHFGRFDLRTGAVLDGPPEHPLHVWKAVVRDGALELER
ncbi:MAG: Rieske (2Fe-2S) region [Frankiales bacterium]|nr:Rieske (2Fe-2S) region [Frankiales bacterium]